MMRILERPGALLALLLSAGLAIGATLVHLATPAPEAFHRPPAHLQCGHAVSEWLDSQ